MAEIKMKHGSWTSPAGNTYRLGITTVVTGDEANASAFATANPDIAEYTATTFSGAGAIVHTANIYRQRALRPELGDVLSRQQKNQSLYEGLRQTKGRAPDQEFLPLVETAGDFDTVNRDDPAVTGERWRQGDLPTDPGQRQQLAAPEESSVKGEELDTQEAVYAATIGETLHQPQETTKHNAGGSSEEERKAAEKSQKKSSGSKSGSKGSSKSSK